MCRRVHEFVVETEIRPELGVIAKPVEELGVVIDRITIAGVSQERSDRAYRAAASLARTKARRLKRVYLQPVAAMGRRLFSDEPTSFRAMARAGGGGYERLIMVASAMADEATTRRDAFVAVGFGENFPDQLRQAALELRETIDARSAHLGRRTAATLGMMQELSKGRELVRLLDLLVRPWLEEHAPNKVAEWKSLTRFERSAPKEKVGGGGAVDGEAPVGTPIGTSVPTVSATPVTTEAHAA